MGEARVDRSTTLAPQDIAAVLDLRDEISAAEGSSPLSDHVLLAIKHASSGSTHFLLREDADVVGYAHLENDDQPVAELAIRPSYDPQPLLDALDSDAGGPVRIWARGEHSALATLLPGLGYHATRVLLQMRRPLDLPLEDPVWPDGVTVRTFRVGEDEAAWLAVNNAAFADHPDQSNWTLEDIRSREQEPWFDPDGFFVAERDGELVGFHWTKVHSGGRGEPVGEVYVVGVAPAMQGHRLGGALTVVGLIYLRDRGLATVKLYTEQTNHAAIGLYERLGFTRYDADRVFERYP